MKTQEIADFLSASLQGDKNVEIKGVADIYTASEGEIAYADRADLIAGTNASCLIVTAEAGIRAAVPLICVADPKLAFALIARELHPSRKRIRETHPTAIIAPSVKSGKDVFFDAFAYVGESCEIGDGTQLLSGVKIGVGVKIGKNCVLHPNVVIEDRCTIGDNVILHSGVVIGADGFGYVRATDEYIKFPQIGSVVIEDDVEIGANSCLDRGALGETRIGKGTKIDNLVQIAHNVTIGKRVIIAAQTGISGSTVIEDDCVIGGQVGIGDHARIHSGAIIGSQAGVLPGKIVRQGVWWGTPVQPLDQYKRQNAHLKGIARLKDEIKNLQNQLAAIERRQPER